MTKHVGFEGMVKVKELLECLLLSSLKKSLEGKKEDSSGNTKHFVKENQQPCDGEREKEKRGA